MAEKRIYSFPIDALLLLGPTGSGKSPLGNELENHGFCGRPCLHLDFGSELRAAVSDNNRSVFYSSEELYFIDTVLEQGLLLENEHFPLAEKIITLLLNRSGFTNRHILVLNGIPRHTGQAISMTPFASVHALIVLDCTVDDVYHRIRENTGRDRCGRVDDDRELIGKKISLFSERTAPLVEYYKKNGSSVYRLPISKDTTPERAHRSLLTLAAAHPPVAFITEPPKR
jgi:adenylate kinase